MRLDKFLCETGFGTRTETKKLIRRGAVTVNGAAALSPDLRINELTAEVIVDGIHAEYKKYIYLIMNKPAGCISATYDKRHSTVIDYVPEEFLHFDPYPVGRLDIDTEGLLILTNDGALSHRLLAPKRHVPKTYYAELDAPIGEAEIEAFRRGVKISEEFTALPAELKILDDCGTQVEVVIYEGKFHQVKRMFVACGRSVEYLKRIKMNRLCLDETLPKGGVRELTEEEMRLLTYEL